MDIDQTLTAENGSTCKGRKREPWERACSECGRAILSACYGRVLCPECKAKARKEAYKKYDATEQGRERRRANVRAYQERHREECNERCRAYREKNREEIRAKGRERYRQNIEHERERCRLGNRARRNRPGAKLEYDKFLGRVKTCPRMRVTMSALPCGKRPECWAGKPCEQCQSMAKPRDKSFGSINRWDF